MIQTSQSTYRASTFKCETSAAVWSQALATMPNSHALQSWTWAEFKSRWGWQMMPLSLTVAESSWEPLATAMVLKRKVPRLPASILYVPKGPALDYSDGDLRMAVLTQLEKLAKQEKAIFIKIDPEVVLSWGLDEDEQRSSTGIQFVQELTSRGWRFSDDQIQFRNTVEIDLTLSEEELLARMKSKTRYNIRLAGRKEVVVRDGTPADFPLLAEMYQETAVRDGFGIRPSVYYLDIWNTFHQVGMGHVLIAEYKREPLAAVYLVKFGQKVIYMYGASTHKERNRMPNYLLQWEAVRWAKAEGCTVYDFWGAPDEFVEADRLWGVWRFKSGFNARVVRHIGAWDYVSRPFYYWVYTAVLPKYLSYLRSRRR
ncbi:MAG: peptidoglycan bridge formation glycyltransferase FemA/FemB family protein [Chloroflexi bacterium]|nr:peptidoglycan bridge formation glycyltransferase FemA/FemB family protein [Chloroflexota bacterium]